MSAAKRLRTATVITTLLSLLMLATFTSQAQDDIRVTFARLLERGASYLDAQQWDQALEVYSEAIALIPTNTDAYFGRGYAYDELGQPEEALADYTRALELDPLCLRECEVVYNNRGKTYMALSDYEAAVADFDRALELKPEFVLTYLNRSLAYYSLSEYELALADVQRTIELDPTLGDPYCVRAFIEDDQGNAQALGDYQYCAKLMGTYTPLSVQNRIRELETQPATFSSSSLNSINLLIGIMVLVAAADLVFRLRQPPPNANGEHERGGWLTLLLGLLLFIGFQAAVRYLFNTADWDQLHRTLPWLNDTEWLRFGLGAVGVLTMISAAALLLWKRWGFYLLIVSTLMSGLTILALGLPIIWAFAGILEIDLIWGRLRSRWAMFA